MSAIVWVKHGDRHQQVRTTREGRLNVRQIASEFGLDADSVQFNGILETYDTNGFTTESIQGGQTEDSAILVAGRAAAGKSHARQGRWSWEPEAVACLWLLGILLFHVKRLSRLTSDVKQE